MIRVRTASFVVPVLLALTAPAWNIPAYADEVDRYMQTRMEKEHIPGISLAVLRDGKIVKAGAYGYANLELKVPATLNTVYQIGSISKQFTAAAILLLVQENRIALDDKVSKYIGGAPETWKDITIRNLLTHTSGLPREDLLTTDKTAWADYSEEEILKSALAKPLLSRPGTKYAYGNLEYDLLAILIEKVSAMTYADFLRQRVFEPLGMSSTRVNDRNSIVPNRAQAFLWTNGGLQLCEPQVSPTLYLGSGALLSTVADLAKWDAALDTDRILTAESRRQMWTAATLPDGSSTNYGFGWVISSVKKHADIHTNGAMNGFVGNISRFVDDRLTVIVLTNQSGLSDTERIATGVARIYIPAIRPAIPSHAPSIGTATPAVLAAAAGHYEYFSNFILTLRSGKDGLLGQLPVGEADDYLPISSTSFWQSDEGTELTLVRNNSGEVTGLIVRQDDGTERTIPRLGPLFHSIPARSDSDPKRTRRMDAALRAIEQGGKAVEQETAISPGAKKDLASGADFSGLQSLSFVGEYEIELGGVERHSEKVTRVIYCNLATDKGALHALLYLTAEGLLADYDIVDD